ncbi:hypothetical protein BSKO_07515 [Bryopsis sp. KO-2023]|nr:hypothetical protein BSKO_07515 [Bryopsis sp. KO-2023]
MDTDGNASSESLGSDIDVDAIIDANDRSLRGAVDFGDDYFNRNTLEQATELIRRELRAHPESSTAAFDAMLRDPVGRRILQDVRQCSQHQPA